MDGDPSRTPTVLSMLDFVFQRAERRIEGRRITFRPRSRLQENNVYFGLCTHPFTLYATTLEPGKGRRTLGDITARYRTAAEWHESYFKVGANAAGFDNLPPIRPTPEFWKEKIFHAAGLDVTRVEVDAPRCLLTVTVPDGQGDELKGKFEVFDDYLRVRIIKGNIEKKRRRSEEMSTFKVYK